uniref:probable RNA-binding protein 46 n=1 Tax=Myxine glutinosa TaxID=7769 RepID=UPI00359008E8
MAFVAETGDSFKELRNDMENQIGEMGNDWKTKLGRLGNKLEGINERKVDRGLSEEVAGVRDGVKRVEKRRFSELEQSVGMAMSLHLMRSPQIPLDQGTERKTNTHALLDLMEKFGYNMIQINGQRRFGPPPDWIGPPPPRGCELFIGSLPYDAFEDELVPVFASVGQIYEFRLMLQFSGKNRGYSFVTYTNHKDSQCAIETLNKYELRPGHQVFVCMNIDNRRLFLGNLPQDKGEKELLEEMKKVTIGVEYVVVHPSKGKAAADRKRAFAFVQYESHRSALLAHRRLLSGLFHLWDHAIQVQWANPDVSCMLTLNVKNLSHATTKRTLRFAFMKALGNQAGGDCAHNGAITKIKKTGLSAVVHFKRHVDALRAKSSLDGAQIDGTQVEVSFARPTFLQHTGDGVMKDRDMHREPGEPQTNSRMVDHTTSRRITNPSQARPHGVAGIPGASRHLAVDFGEAFWRIPNVQETFVSTQEIDLAVARTATVYIVNVHAGMFAPEEVCSVLDGAKELAAQSVLRKLGCPSG